MHVFHRRQLLVTLFAAIFLGIGANGAHAQAARPLNLIVFGGGVNWPLWVAQDEKLFERNNLAVNVTTTPNSVFQITGMQDGKFDIAMTTFDNVVAYQEGQGEAALPRTPDFFAFMGGGIGGLRLLANPENKSIADLKGKTLGVDAAATGYVLAMRKLLQQGGLGNDDYKFDRIGSTVARVEALQQNKVAATMVNAPSDLGPLARGYKPLADVSRDLGPYQQLSGMASRAWARQNEEKLLSFIISYKTAMDWLFNPDNKAAALAIYQKHLAGVTPAQAEGAYGSLLNGSDGLQREARLSLPGVRKVIELRAEYGEPKKPMGEAAKYIDESYYNNAIRRSGRAGG
jgi:ABC-type nitrate/sulfonate/bicarbonate transport system substrate-binding protein